MTEKTEAAFHEVRRSWLTSKNVDECRNYLGMHGRISVASLLSHMATIAPHVTPDQMLLNFATVTWTDASTPEERDERIARKEAAQARTDAWERETYERLHAKFAAADVEPRTQPTEGSDRE